MSKFIKLVATGRALSRRKPICGVGINDSWYMTNSKDSSGKIIRCPIYCRWKAMIERCYDNKSLTNSYDDCHVCEEWLKFSVFAAWMETQNYKGLHLDKDIVVTGNRIYSPETCIFVTREINNLLALGGSSKTTTHFDQTRNKYTAVCRSEGGSYFIGRYDTEQEAYNAYIITKSKVISDASKEQQQPLRGYLELISMEFLDKYTK